MPLKLTATKVKPRNAGAVWQNIALAMASIWVSGATLITPNAIRVDQPTPYANTGSNPVQLGGDAANLYWFADESLDFLYSSHLLEDFENCEKVLREWLRVLRPGGY